VSLWTSRDVREVIKSHLNYVVADTLRWEQSATYFIDSHPSVKAFVKNSGLGFAIPYFHNGEPHDYVPDFIIRLRRQDADAALNVILETKGFDPLEEVKSAAAERWVDAVNADGKHGQWRYKIVRRPEQVRKLLNELTAALSQ
jgi:type III restriction enzyme